MAEQHTVKAFDEDINRLRGLIAEMGGRVETAIEEAMTALIEQDVKKAKAVVLGDERIDALEAEVERLVVQIIALRAPLVSIFFEGVNGVDGKYATNRIYKAKLGVAQNVGYISEDFNTLSLTFSIEKDTTVSGGGISQFLKLESET